jgi:Papain family cysteine protease
MTRLLVGIYLFFTIGSQWAAAQQKGTGLLCSDERYRTVPVLPVYTGVKFNDVPIRTSLKKYCPVAGNQQQIGACVGWAVGYNAMTILRAINANVTDKVLITQKANSAAFVYNQLRPGEDADCNKGTFIEDALVLLKEKGDCLENSFNYQSTANCQTKPDNKAFKEAVQYRIRDFASVFGVQEIGKNKTASICKMLATNTPVVVGMGVTKTFLDILPGQKRWDPTPEEPVDSYHAMVVVGYDNVEKHFELLNSFGAAWGRNGYIEVKYDDFERLCRYAYVMTLEKNGEQAFVPQPLDKQPDATAEAVSANLELSGEFVFRQPTGSAETPDGKDVFLFEEVPTQRIDNELLYITKQAQFGVGDVFQLLARNIPKGRYAYIFSQNPEGTINLHFPKNPMIAEFFIDQTAEIVLPAEDLVLQLSSPGNDHLCVLYSLTKIVDIKTRLAALERLTLTAPFSQKINQIFGDVLIDSAMCHYHAENMRFTAEAQPQLGKTVVPLILRVKAQ